MKLNKKQKEAKKIIKPIADSVGVTDEELNVILKANDFVDNFLKQFDTKECPICTEMQPPCYGSCRNCGYKFVNAPSDRPQS